MDENRAADPCDPANADCLVEGQVAADRIILVWLEKGCLDDEQVGAAGCLDEVVIRSSVAGHDDPPAGLIA